MGSLKDHCLWFLFFPFNNKNSLFLKTQKGLPFSNNVLFWRHTLTWGSSGLLGSMGPMAIFEAVGVEVSIASSPKVQRDPGQTQYWDLCDIRLYTHINWSTFIVITQVTHAFGCTWDFCRSQAHYLLHSLFRSSPRCLISLNDLMQVQTDGWSAPPIPRRKRSQLLSISASQPGTGNLGSLFGFRAQGDSGRWGAGHTKDLDIVGDCGAKGHETNTLNDAKFLEISVELWWFKILTRDFDTVISLLAVSRSSRSFRDSTCPHASWSTSASPLKGLDMVQGCFIRRYFLILLDSWIVLQHFLFDGWGRGCFTLCESAFPWTRGSIDRCPYQCTLLLGRKMKSVPPAVIWTHSDVGSIQQIHRHWDRAANLHRLRAFAKLSKSLESGPEGFHLTEDGRILNNSRIISGTTSPRAITLQEAPQRIWGILISSLVRILVHCHGCALSL